MNFENFDIDQIAHEEIPIFGKTEVVKYLVTGRHFKKDSTSIQDGLILDLIATAKRGVDQDGKAIEIPLVVVDQDDNGGYKIEFPFGKKGLKKVMFRGKPKSGTGFYKWTVVTEKDGKENKTYKALAEKDFTFAGFLDYARKTKEPVDDWGDQEALENYEEYLEHLFGIGFQIDFNINPVGDPSKMPDIGMSTWFYRSVVDAKVKEGEEKPKYDKDVRIHKYPPKDSGLPTIPGDFKRVSPEVAIAIEREYAFNEDQTQPPAGHDTSLDDLPF